MSRRILLLGPTGMDKKDVAVRLSKLGESQWHYRGGVKVVRFEQEYVDKIAGAHYQFLNEKIHRQKELWDKAWDNFVTTLNEDASDVIILSMHGAVVWSQYGARVILDPSKVVNDFKPDVIITLIDDVYDMWWRTEHRAQGADYFGRPSLEQLIEVRRVELIVGDQIAAIAGPNCRHFALAMSHPIDCLSRLAYAPKPTVVYTCIPITGPREMEAQGDLSGIEEINSFLKEVIDTQLSDNTGSLVMICPLTIDELPFRGAFAAEKSKALGSGVGLRDFLKNTDFTFDRDKLRWPLSGVWSDPMTLGVDKQYQKAIPALLVENVTGLIYTDVGLRDFRLVAQSDCLLVYNPCFREDKISRSVKQEITDASSDSKPVFAFQDPAKDPKKVFETSYSQGTMPSAAANSMIQHCASVKEAISKVLQLHASRQAG